MRLNCSHCQSEVDREQCHRNRYGELICRACQLSGVRYTWRQRLRYFGKKAPRYAVVGLAVFVALLLLIMFFYLILSSGSGSEL
jgi:hypothetical protein